MHRPLVSICIPAYEQTTYLSKALDSIAIQRFDDYEIILTDDSLTDSVERFIGTHPLRPRIRYVRNPTRRGSPGNWNACIALGRGSLIKILHHDDWLVDDESLGEFVAIMAANPTANFGFCATRVVEPDGRFRRIHRASSDARAALQKDPDLLFVGNLVGAPSATIYRAACGLRFDERLKWLVDVDFYIRMLEANGRFAFCERPLVCTPSGAKHQVTEECQNNAQIELQEHMIVFDKIAGRVGNSQGYVKYWRGLLARHQVWSFAALEGYASVPEKLLPFFRKVFANPLWLRIRYGIPRRVRNLLRVAVLSRV